MAATAPAEAEMHVKITGWRCYLAELDRVQVPEKEGEEEWVIIKYGLTGANQNRERKGKMCTLSTLKPDVCVFDNEDEMRSFENEILNLLQAYGLYFGEFYLRFFQEKFPEGKGRDGYTEVFIMQRFVFKAIQECHDLVRQRDRLADRTIMKERPGCDPEKKKWTILPYFVKPLVQALETMRRSGCLAPNIEPRRMLNAINQSLPDAELTEEEVELFSQRIDDVVAHLRKANKKLTRHQALEGAFLCIVMSPMLVKLVTINSKLTDYVPQGALAQNLAELFVNVFAKLPSMPPSSENSMNLMQGTPVELGLDIWKAITGRISARVGRSQIRVIVQLEAMPLRSPSTCNAVAMPQAGGLSASAQYSRPGAIYMDSSTCSTGTSMLLPHFSIAPARRSSACAAELPRCSIGMGRSSTGMSLLAPRLSIGAPVRRASAYAAELPRPSCGYTCHSSAGTFAQAQSLRPCNGAPTHERHRRSSTGAASAHKVVQAFACLKV